MMKTVCLSFVGFLSILCCGNFSGTAMDSSLGTEDSLRHLRKSIDFIKQVKSRELHDTNFLLSNRPFQFTYFNCLEKVLSDTSFFSKDELGIIRSKQFSRITEWGADQFAALKLIHADTVSSIFQDGKKWWGYYYRKFGKGFSTFSVPYFLRNDTYCLFYSDYHCGGECGEGRLILYKKEGDSWVPFKTYCSWIS